ncbi:hypothetical protein [Planctomicrobium piriforme]|uniref:hypothetical protein n=1 Tax=Planctomicrobium piriforme TaxID=1576369 RepID=UPI0011143550|nr:hypothetical protein [Planctomicrobium piriforme]
MSAQNWPIEATRVPVIFTNGHDTEAADKGLPVKLLAGGLGVPDSVFRSALTQLQAVRGVAPNEWQLQTMQTYLFKTLAKYDVSAYRLETVTAYYRHEQPRGELWPTKSAKAFAVIDNGRLLGFEVLNGGSGYSSAPTVSIPGHNNLFVNIDIAYGREFGTNGSITSITLAELKKKL